MRTARIRWTTLLILAGAALSAAGCHGPNSAARVNTAAARVTTAAKVSTAAGVSTVEPASHPTVLTSHAKPPARRSEDDIIDLDGHYQPPVRPVDVQRLFEGPDVDCCVWSPDGKWLSYNERTDAQVAAQPTAYFIGAVQGQAVFHEVGTGFACRRYNMNTRYAHEGRWFGTDKIWLPDGKLLLATLDGQVLRVDQPCGDAEDLTKRFPGRIEDIVGLSPDRKLLLVGLSDGHGYGFYDLARNTFRSIMGIGANLNTDFTWSPSGAFLGILVPGDQDSKGKSVGAKACIADIASGRLVACQPFEAEWAVDGIFGGPDWLSEREMVVSQSVDQGPFVLATDGVTRSLLTLFGAEVKTYAPAEIKVSADRATGGFHALYDPNFHAEDPDKRPLLYHSETGLTETLTAAGPFWFVDDDHLEYDDESTANIRPLDPPGSPFVARPRDQCDPSCNADRNRYTAKADPAGVVVVTDTRSGEVVANVEPRGMPKWTMGHVSVSPNGTWLALTLYNDAEDRMMLALCPVPLGDGTPAP